MSNPLTPDQPPEPTLPERLRKAYDAYKADGVALEAADRIEALKRTLSEREGRIAELEQEVAETVDHQVKNIDRLTELVRTERTKADTAARERDGAVQEAASYEDERNNAIERALAAERERDEAKQLNAALVGDMGVLVNEKRAAERERAGIIERCAKRCRIFAAEYASGSVEERVLIAAGNRIESLSRALPPVEDAPSLPTDEQPRYSYERAVEYAERMGLPTTFPDGYVRVPREPTEEMLRAALDARYCRSKRSRNVKEKFPAAYETWIRVGLATDAIGIREEYNAALAAAPKEPK